MITTIRLNYSCTLAIPVDMSRSEVSALFELLSRCNKVDSLYADKAKESVEYLEMVEVTIKRVSTLFLTKDAASARAVELNAAVALREAAEA